MNRRFYELLGVSEDASEDEIRMAYKRASSKCHPDKNPGREEEAAKEFQDMKQAYETLSDPDKRAHYDENGDGLSETGNPAEDMFVDILSKLVESAPSLRAVLETCRSVLDDLIEEASNRQQESRKTVERIKSMREHLRFKGKGTNIADLVLQKKLAEAEQEIVEFDAAIKASKLVWGWVKEYSSTEPPDRKMTTPNQALYDRADKEFRSLFGPLGG